MSVSNEFAALAWLVAGVVIGAVIQAVIMLFMKSLAECKRIKAVNDIIRRELAEVRVILRQLPAGPSTDAIKSHVDRIEAAAADLGLLWFGS